VKTFTLGYVLHSLRDILHALLWERRKPRAKTAQGDDISKQKRDFPGTKFPLNT
jgi:hypothetical protein